MVSFTNHYNVISIDKLPSKTKIGNIHDTLIILLYVTPRPPQLQRHFFLLKHTHTHTQTHKNKYSCSGPQHLKVEVAD